MNFLKVCGFNFTTTTDGEEEPFYIAEVTDNDFHKDILDVRWYRATDRSKAKFANRNNTKVHHMMHYELELLMVNQRGWQNSYGGRRVRLDENHHQIPYDEVGLQRII